MNVSINWSVPFKYAFFVLLIILKLLSKIFKFFKFYFFLKLFIINHLFILKQVFNKVEVIKILIVLLFYGMLLNNFFLSIDYTFEIKNSFFLDLEIDFKLNILKF